MEEYNWFFNDVYRHVKRTAEKFNQNKCVNEMEWDGNIGHLFLAHCGVNEFNQKHISMGEKEMEISDVSFSLIVKSMNSIEKYILMRETEMSTSFSFYLCNDRERAGYIRRFFLANWNICVLFDFIDCSSFQLYCSLCRLCTIF